MKPASVRVSMPRVLPAKSMVSALKKAACWPSGRVTTCVSPPRAIMSPAAAWMPSSPARSLAANSVRWLRFQCEFGSLAAGRAPGRGGGGVYVSVAPSRLSGLVSVGRPPTTPARNSSCGHTAMSERTGTMFAAGTPRRSASRCCSVTNRGSWRLSKRARVGTRNCTSGLAWRAACAMKRGSRPSPLTVAELRTIALIGTWFSLNSCVVGAPGASVAWETGGPTVERREGGTTVMSAKSCCWRSTPSAPNRRRAPRAVPAVGARASGPRSVVGSRVVVGVRTETRGCSSGAGS